MKGRSGEHAGRVGARRRLRTGAALATVSALAYKGTIEGKLTLDLNLGRRIQPLVCEPVDIAAPREVVFDVLTAPYAARQARAMAEKVTVLERGTDMVLAAHRTPVRGGLVATTIETVRFTRPDRIEFRLLRGPVPHVVEAFELHELPPTGSAAPAWTRLAYSGQLGTDLWALGTWWGAQVAAAWQQAVAESMLAAKVESERRAR